MLPEQSLWMNGVQLSKGFSYGGQYLSIFSGIYMDGTQLVQSVQIGPKLNPDSGLERNGILGS